jgi:NADPH:quinone reductase-like Zn-dependent oxidoreductase
MMQFTLRTCQTPSGRRVDVTLLVTRPTDVSWTERLARWFLGREPAPAQTQHVIRGSFIRVAHRYGLLRWSETSTGLDPTDWLARVTGELQRGVLERHIASVVELAEAGDHRTAEERDLDRELGGGR